MGEWVKYQSGSLKKSLVGDTNFCLFVFFFFFFFFFRETKNAYNFFFQLISWKMSVNFYIGFHKNKIKKFIGLNSQIFVIILGSSFIFINLIYLFFN